MEGELSKSLKSYHLTYPYTSNIIYESRNFDKAVEKCYKEFKNFNDIHDGMFVVTDNNDVEHKFVVKNKNIEQAGGSNLNILDSNLEKIKNNYNNVSKIITKIKEEDVNSTSSIESLGPLFTLDN